MSRTTWEVAETVNASKVKLGRAEALELARAASEVWVAKGKKLEKLRTKDAGDDAIASRILGPTGNLRAPTFRKGKKVVVGYNEEAYRTLLVD